MSSVGNLKRHVGGVRHLGGQARLGAKLAMSSLASVAHVAV